ncbi:DUF3703 domain-containing protein [uncultured Marivirga sp.]|uniref:DUF3703 domain-containing protein n=1 Tax=uncultured Marivirga sp. TaxID=1123707 RepID=UPI0030ED9CDE|tara:strand:+ start:17375 stop:17758 length:384 start_codon:yes stop_codon:yes gene_type:complete
MNFNTLMPERLKIYYCKELELYREYLNKKELPKAWQQLERAHVLGQPYPFQHSEVHWLMLKFGIRIKSTKEIIGQIPRLLVGGVKSFVGRIPVGNTGGANVPPLQSMPIEKDILDIIEKSKIESKAS